MFRRSPAETSRQLSLTAVVVALSLFVVTCSEKSPTEAPSVSHLTPQATVNSTDTDGAIEVTVKYKGKGLDDLLVTAVHRTYGPTAVPETFDELTMAVTDADGKATILGLLVPGEYCVTVRALPFRLVEAYPDLIVPYELGVSEPATVDGFATISERKRNRIRWVNFTGAKYEANCTDGGDNDPAVELTTRNPTAKVSVKLTPASRLRLGFTDLVGDPVDYADVWAVIPVSVPWASGAPAGENPGALVSTGEASGPTTMNGLPPGVEVAIEALLASGQGDLTFSGRETTPGAGEEEEVEGATEPLMCEFDRTEEPAGDVDPNTVDIEPWVKDGFRGGADFESIRQLSIFYDVVAFGNDELHMRFSVPGQTDNLVAKYSVSSSGCSDPDLSGPADVTVELFCRPNDAGGIRVTWVISLGNSYGDDLEDLEAVEYQLKDFPPPGEGERSFKQIDVLRPGTTCTAVQSNDPKWWVAN
jgi:hypothetical protein